jgi:hypothetical protein
LLRTGVRLGVIRTPKWLVKRALRAMFRGRRVISPAFMNIYLPFLVAMLPGPIEARLWEKFK